MSQIPRGIQVVQWKNSTDKSKSVRYRVRISKKTFKCDELFQTLEEAKEYLSSTKSLAGISKITELSNQSQKERELISDFLSSPPFSYYVNLYKEKYIDINDDGTELKQRNIKTEKKRFDSILNVEVSYVQKKLQNISGIIATQSIKPKKTLGQLKLEEIDEVVITNYISARLNPEKIDFEALEKMPLNENQKKALADEKKNQRKIPAKSTVKREVDMLSSVFNKIRYIDKSAWQKKLNGINPVQEADKTLLKHYDKVRKARINKSTENDIVKILKEFKNQEMLFIFLLALSTGMRRSEVLFLKFSDIDFKNNLILLKKTKSGKERDVLLSENSKEIIELIPKKDERLFHYTIDGWSANWTRIRKRNPSIAHVKMHDTRREFISKTLELLGKNSSIVIADMIGMSDINHFESSYIIDESNTQNEVLKSVGHDKKSTTQRYFKREIN